MLIDIHTHNSTGRNIEVVVLDPRKLDNDRPILWCLGIHPWYIEDIPNTEKFLKENHSKSLFALGEIGLDKSIETSLDVQKKVFMTQLHWAKTKEIPRIVIHCVRAYNEVFKCLKESGYQGKILFHGFNSSDKMAQQLMDHFDCYFSLGAKLLNPKSTTTKLLTKLPIDRIFLETDDELEITISAIYQAAANTLDMPKKELEKRLEANFEVFSN